MDTRALLDSLDLGVVAIASDWTIAEWSAAAARMTGLPGDRVLRRECWEAFPRARGGEVERVLRQVLADGRPRASLLPSGPSMLEARITRGPANHLLLVLHQPRDVRMPDPRAGDLLAAFEAERSL